MKASTRIRPTREASSEKVPAIHASAVKLVTFVPKIVASAVSKRAPLLPWITAAVVKLPAEDARMIASLMKDEVMALFTAAATVKDPASVFPRTASTVNG